MDLAEFYDNQNPKSDKGTDHDYIRGYYNNLFSSLKENAISLLEIGVQEGYSFALWRAWFTQASITCFDLGWQSTIDYINTQFNSKAYKADAFTVDAINKLDGESYDFIIEDGPHTLETQIFAVEHWTKKLKVNGKLVIEDIQSPEKDVSIILAPLQNRTNLTYRLIDLRSSKGRWDDYIIEITRAY
jgi:hypothetical protein